MYSFLHNKSKQETALHREASLLDIRKHLVQDQKLSRRRQQYVKIRDQELLNAWYEYEEGELNVKQLLQRISKVGN